MRSLRGVDKVCDLLLSAGYQLHGEGLRVAGVDFEFPAVLTQHLDLIVVEDSLVRGEGALVREIEALGEALDVAGSRRTLTLVISGAAPSQQAMASLSRCCRVLPVGTGRRVEDADSLQRSLAVFMPLKLPSASQLVADPVAEIASGFSDDPTGEVNAFLMAAAQSSGAVEERLAQLVADALDAEEEDS